MSRKKRTFLPKPFIKQEKHTFIFHMESLLWGCPGHHPAQLMWRGILLAELELTSHGQNSQERWVTLQCPRLPAGGSLSKPAAMQPCSPKKGGWWGAEDARMYMGLGNTCMFDWRRPYKITLCNLPFCDLKLHSCKILYSFPQQLSMTYLLCVHWWKNNSVPRSCGAYSLWVFASLFPSQS